MKKLLLGSTALVLSLNTAIAQVRSPPSVSAIQREQTPFRGNLFSWHPFGNNLNNSLATAQWLRGTGHTYGGVMELEDQFDMVRLRFESGGSNNFTVQQVAVGASSSFGITPGTNPGAYSYDSLGAVINAMLPVTFNGAGSCAALPYPGGNSNFGGTTATTGTLLLSLAAPATTSPVSTITFATLLNSLTGSQVPVVGMSVFDALGNIAASTTVSSVNTGTGAVGLSNPTTGNTLAGQNIYFGWKANPTLTLAVGPSTNAPEIQEKCSDWIPISSFYRVDGGFQRGEAVAGTNVGAGLSVVSIAYGSVTLSGTTSGTVAINTPITFSFTGTATAAVSSGGFKVPYTSSITPNLGTTVTGTGIPANTTVIEVGSGFIRLSNAVNVTGVSSGGTLTFSHIAYTNTSNAANTGTLSFVSTDNKPLLTVHGFATGGASTVSGVLGTTASSNVAEQKDGLPYWGFLINTNAVDGANFPNATGFTQLLWSFVTGADYIGRHRGISIAFDGDSIFSGSTTANSNASFVRMAGAALSKPSFPVSVANLAQGGSTSNVFHQQMSNFMQANKPNIALLEYWSPNGNYPIQTEIPKTDALVNYVLGYGGIPILANMVPQQIVTVGQFYTVGATNSSTALTLNASTLDYPSGTFEVQGSCIPAGTTATLVQEAFSLTLSQAASCADHSLISFGNRTVSGNVTASTAITFTGTTPYPTGTYTISGTGIGAGVTVALTLNSATGTLSSNQTIADQTVVTIGQAVSQTIRQQATAAMNNAGKSNALPVFDMYTCSEDPNNQTFFLPGISAEGTHMTDYGHSLMAFGGNNGCAGLLNLLSNIINH